MIAGTYTHSGPITVDCLSNEVDPVVSTADPKYQAFMQERIVNAGVIARPAQIGFALADDTASAPTTAIPTVRPTIRCR